MDYFYDFPGHAFSIPSLAAGSLSGHAGIGESGGGCVISGNARVAVVALLLSVTGLFLHARIRSVVSPPRTSLASFPLQLGEWVGTDIPIPAETLKVLDRGEFLQRDYRDQNTRGPEVSLYLAYFPDQRVGRRGHLPEECLAGSGWSTVESATTTLSLPGYAPFPANRYVITKGPDRQLVLFWFWGRGRGVASEDWADFYLVFDSLRLNRSDDALIRINTPLQADEEPDAGQRRVLAFAERMSPLVGSYIPR
jgi:EpsI family protein